MRILRKFLFGFLLLIVSGVSYSQDTALFMCYNLLNYYSNTADSATRNPYFRTVIQSAKPDVLATVEVKNDASSKGFLNTVLKKVNSDYVRAPFSDNSPNGDSYSSLYYLSSRFSCISNIPIRTNLRDINDYTLINLRTNDTIHIYVVHLKASNGDTEAATRVAEVNELRKITDALPPNTPFMVCGDFNFYSSTEPAYVRLTEFHTGKYGEFYDPLNMPGVWNSPSYAINHTQSTRRRSFGGGVTGGLDDRFDLFLFSNSIKTYGSVRYLSGSNKAYGNDGKHLNDSINQLPNTAVSSSVANALHYASDHLPVLIKFVFGYHSNSIETVSNQSPSFNIFPNPVMKECFIEPTQNSRYTILLYDLNGRLLLEKDATQSTAIHLQDLSPGIYIMKLVSERYSEVYRIVHY